MTSTQPITIRVPKNLVDHLDEVSRAMDRSRSRQIIHYIRVGLEVAKGGQIEDAEAHIAECREEVSSC